MASFKMLWDNFPDDEVIKKKCFNKQSHGNTPFDNYCSILMSECFNQSGISLESCPAVKCWSHTGKKHVIRAEQLAKWLSTHPPKGFGAREKIVPGKFQTQLAGRTGVIFFKDYWTRGNETFNNRSGDHIDLWNKNRITGGSMIYRSIIELIGLVSDLNKSRNVWFWEVK
ncbi:MAG: type VI secretion system amidase effector protein Tae4 [Methylococcaceae bacterium]|nr:type VI secretion system amidase effector protein Tae4 [Methylococcaceae bacterium]